jgi:hypothetical protein
MSYLPGLGDKIFQKNLQIPSSRPITGGVLVKYDIVKVIEKQEDWA